MTRDPFIRPRLPLGRRPAALLLAPALLLALGSACAVDEPGTNPARDAFYFPTGLVPDPVRQVLYVASMNADLRYNGGTIAALDLTDLPADLRQVGAQVKAGKLTCAPDRVDVTLWECPEAQFIDGDSTVRVGDYPGELRISSDGKRLFTPMRGDSYLAWVDVEPLGQNGVDLRCDNRTDGGCAGLSGRDCPVWDCDDAHKVSYSSARDFNLPREPRGIYLHELSAVYVDAAGVRRTCRDGVSQVSCLCAVDPAEATRVTTPCLVDGQAVTTRCVAGSVETACWEPTPASDHVYLSHLYGGEVSFFTVSDTPAGGQGADQPVKLMDSRGGFFSSGGGILGGYDLSAWRPGDRQTPVSVSSRSDRTLASFVIDDTRIITGPRTTITTINQARDVRGIVYEPRRQRLYAVSRSPAALLAIDMSLEDGSPRRETLWVTEVCPSPSLLRLNPSPTEPSDPDALLAYVVCFGTSQIFVVDTRSGALLDQIPTGGGPFQLEFDPTARRAFVTHFLDNTVGVLDLDPSHPRFHRMVLRIGRQADLVRN